MFSYHYKCLILLSEKHSQNNNSYISNDMFTITHNEIEVQSFLVKKCNI